MSAGTNTACQSGNVNNPMCDADNRLQMNAIAPALAKISEPLPDLGLAMRWSPAPVETTATQLTFTVDVKNSGGRPATDVRVTDIIPPGTAYVNGSASQGGAFTGGQVVWSGLTVAAGQTASLSFSVNITNPLSDGDRLVNTVQVTSAEGGRHPAHKLYHANRHPAVVLAPDRAGAQDGSTAAQSGAGHAVKPLAGGWGQRAGGGPDPELDRRRSGWGCGDL